MPFELHSRTKSQPAIEETRHSPASVDGSLRKGAIPHAITLPRGVLQAVGRPGDIVIHPRLVPPAVLAPWIEHFWMVEWDMRGASPRQQETLPHPSVYLVFEQKLDQPLSQSLPPCAAEISGVTTGKWSRSLEGWGRAFGVKFKPGGFRGYLGRTTASITDRVLPAQQVFGPAVLELAADIYRCADAEAMTEATSTFLQSRQPVMDASAELSAQLVALVFADPSILTVDRLAARAGMTVRSLQRLFKNYVGVSPKWVIRRYRLHELVERLHSGQTFDGAQLALDLGYADQAHLINDFRSLVGYTPTAYLKVAAIAP